MSQSTQSQQATSAPAAQSAQCDDSSILDTIGSVGDLGGITGALPDIGGLLDGDSQSAVLDLDLTAGFADSAASDGGGTLISARAANIADADVTLEGVDLPVNGTADLGLLGTPVTAAIAPTGTNSAADENCGCGGGLLGGLI